MSKLEKASVRLSWRSDRLGQALALYLLLAGQGAEAMAAPVQIYSAGSLKAVMGALIGASGLPAGSFADPIFGSAGLMRERIEKGEHADLFTSADMAQPARLAKDDPARKVVPFAGNRMCVISPASVGLTATNLLDKLLAPEFRLATSTPVADPGGDYAMAVFDKAETVRPGAGAALRAKAMHLLGAPGAMASSPGKNSTTAIFLDNKADALIYYCSGAPTVLKEVQGLTSLPMPDTLEVYPTYGMVLLTAIPDAARFATFITSPAGQDILSRFG